MNRGNKAEKVHDDFTGWLLQISFKTDIGIVFEAKP